MRNNIDNKLIVIMGVSGSGKSTIAKLIAKDLSADFIDADDFHSTENKANMGNNVPLSDKKRLSWVIRVLDSVCQRLQQNKNTIVLAYSGLKKKHRMMFKQLPYEVQFYWLNPPYDLLLTRLNNRKNHFVNTSFLASQLQDFEPPKSDEKHIDDIASTEDSTAIKAHIIKAIGQYEASI